jgi:hypothetical protein
MISRNENIVWSVHDFFRACTPFHVFHAASRTWIICGGTVAVTVSLCRSVWRFGNILVTFR